MRGRGHSNWRMEEWSVNPQLWPVRCLRLLRRQAPHPRSRLGHIVRPRSRSTIRSRSRSNTAIAAASGPYALSAGAGERLDSTGAWRVAAATEATVTVRSGGPRTCAGAFFGPNGLTRLDWPNILAQYCESIVARQPK